MKISIMSWANCWLQVLTLYLKQTINSIYMTKNIVAHKTKRLPNIL